MAASRHIPTDIHDALETSLLRQNDFTVRFQRNNATIIMSCVRWDNAFYDLYTRTQFSTVPLDVITYPCGD